MRILLINTPFLGGYKELTLDMPSLGPAYIASVLREYKHKVTIVDMNVDYQSLPSRFDDFDLVGLSSDTPRHNLAIQLAKKIKQYNVPIVIGGPHASFMIEETLKTGLIDYIIRGEGEYSMLSLVQHLANKSDISTVPGISYLKDGRIVHNPPQPVISEVDDLPFPARDLLPMEKYTSQLEKRKATSVIGSRGCPFHCSFCASSELFGLRWRAREPEAIVDEIQEIKKHYDIQAIFFIDDNFTLDPNRTIKICELIKKRDLDIKWWCFSRVDTVVKREDMVQAMAEAGAKMTFLGIETPNPEILENYHKKIDADMSIKAINILQKYKIQTMASFIIGELHESKEMIKNTIRFACKLEPEVAQFSILTPYPGTQLYKQVIDRILTKNWNLYDGLHAVMKTYHIDPEEIEKLLRKAYKTFYLQPKRLLKDPVAEFKLLIQLPKILKT